MEDFKFVRYVDVECPICGERHYVEERKRDAIAIIRGVTVTYEETYLHCDRTDDLEKEYETGELVNSNLLSARNKYRELFNLLTSDELISIRNAYGLSHTEMGLLLNINIIDLVSYETKSIQTRDVDDTIRSIRDNPRILTMCLEEYVGNNITEERKNQIRERIPKRYLR